MSNAVTDPPCSFAKIMQPMPIGPAPTTRTRSPFLRIGAAHRVGADGEELDHRRLIERDAVGCGHIALRHADVIRHSAINVNAEDGDALAAIGLAAPAGDAGAAGQIGDHKDPFDRPSIAQPGPVSSTSPDSSCPITRGYSRNGCVPS